MARIQRIESDSAFTNANILPGTIMTWKALDGNRIKIMAKKPDGSVVEIVPKVDLKNYYDKGEIDGFLHDLSNSISALWEYLQNNYYTSIQIDKKLSDSYYDKFEIEGIVSNFPSNSAFQALSQQIQILTNTPVVHGIKGLQAIHVTSNSHSQLEIQLQVDQNVFNNTAAGLSSRLTLVKLDQAAQGFASSYQLQGADGQPIGDIINIIRDMYLQDASYIPEATAQDHEEDSNVIVGQPYIKFICYLQSDSQPASYSKSLYIPVKQLISTYIAGRGLVLTGNKFDIKSDSGSQTNKYLVITEDTIGLHGIDQAIGIAASNALQEAKRFVLQLSNSFSIGDYYTKWEIDGKLSNSYYTKDEIDKLIESLSDSFSLSNYYTEEQINVLLAKKYDLSDALVLQQDVANLRWNALQLVPFDSISQGVYTISRPVVVMGVYNNNGIYFPIQAESVQYSSDSTIVRLAPYLAYSNMSTFTGTWKLLIANLGNRE